MGAIGKLKVSKAWYCTSRYSSDKNADGTLKIQQGWVVTGLIGGNNDFYYVPQTYAGLPIIGVLHTAYETLNEYKDDNACHKTGDNKIDLPVRLDLYTQKLLFVFPPRRYSNRYHVVPTYIVDSEKNNYADMYGAAYFSYARGAGVNNLVTQIMKIKNVPYSYGYTCLGRVEDSFSYLEKIGYNKEQKRTDKFTITMRQASAKTYDTCYKPSYDKLIDYVPDKHTDLWRASWKALRVGKYYSLGKFDRRVNEVSDYFDEHKSVLGFVWQPVNENIACAFNLIGGTEVTFSPVASIL